MKAVISASALALMVTLAPEAEASKVCAPDNRGCFNTRVKCKDVDIPKTWTCTKTLAVNRQTGDIISRDKDGRPVILANRQAVYILSDALDAQFTQKKPSADEFARAVLADHGAVSELSLQQISKELDIPITMQPAVNLKLQTPAKEKTNH